MIARVITLSPLMANTYAPDRLPDTMYDLLDKDFTLLRDENGDYYGCWLGGEQVHPLVTRDMNDNKSYGFNVLGTAYANLKPVAGLTITSNLGYRLSSANSYYYSNKYYGATSAYNNTANSVNRTTLSSVYYQWENYASYNRSFEQHTINGMAGMSFSENDNTYVYGGVSDVVKDEVAFKDVSYPHGSATHTARGTQTPTRKLSYFGRMEYNYGDRYNFNALFRADAADAAYLPSSGRWGYFPGISAGWTLSNESFFSEIQYLDYTKLRGSWGQNGSISNLGGYRYSSAITNVAAGYPYGSAPIYQIAGYPAQMSNPELKWETSEQLNIGLDLRFLKNRLSISADWYKKKTKDLIVSGAQLPLEVGNASPPINAGNVENTGLEIDLGWRGRSGDFSYSINANFATLKNRVTYLDPSISDNRLYGSAMLGPSALNLTAFEVGHPVWYFFGYKVDGIDEVTGEPIFRDLTGEGDITTDDKTEIGKPMPDFTYGITMNLAWKGLDLTVFGSGAHGNDVYSCLTYGGVAYNYKDIYEQAWSPNNTVAKYAKPGASAAESYLTSEGFVFDASYFKIKQIQLGYSLPQKWMNKIFLNRVRAYISLEDFICITNYPGLDPEVSASAVSGMGIDYGNYPNTKKVVFGLNIEF
jgi:TonB-linked SusC/RagA family outer membrane protein